MKTLAKVLLVLSVLSLIVGLSPQGSNLWFGILIPVAALLFITAFIIQIVVGLDTQQSEGDRRKVRTAPDHGSHPAAHPQHAH